MTRTKISVVASLVAAMGCSIQVADVSAQDLATVRLTNNLNDPLYVTTPPNEADGRLFVVEQISGRIRILHSDGSLTTFLDVSSRISAGGERGLLGLAFHPDYVNNGYFYINYTNNSGDTEVARYTVSANPDVADPGTNLLIIGYAQPFTNHNGGCLQFGPDGYLYIGSGDGGSGGDPFDNAQNPMSPLGKMLRIDVDNPDGGNNYGIPADNPFVDDPGTLDEIWALGLRNPWRYSFDRETGDLYTADVGQGEWEEIDFQPASSPGGENYGWRLKEGNECFDPPNNCDPGGLTDPIYQYEHTFFPQFRCSVTGGYVYRGSANPILQGTYFFADYCSNEIFSFRYDGASLSEFQERTNQLTPNIGQIRSITSFGQDQDGEMYIIDGGGGELFKIVTAMRLSAAPLVSNQNASLSVAGAPANARVYFIYGVSGTGETFVPQLNVTLALNNPRLGGASNANASGNASLTPFVPAIAQGQTVWLQAAVSGNTSNVVSDTVQ